MELPLFIALLLVAAVSSSVGAVAFLSERHERLERPRQLAAFTEDLRKALNFADVSWDQVKVLASVHAVTTAGTKHALENLLSRSITGALEEQQDNFIDRIETFLQELESEEPYQGLPDDLQLHLRRLEGELGDNTNLLQPLTQNLKEQIEDQKQHRTKQTRVAYVSLLVSLLGAITGAVTLFF